MTTATLLAQTNQQIERLARLSSRPIGLKPEVANLDISNEFYLYLASPLHALRDPDHIPSLEELQEHLPDGTPAATLVDLTRRALISALETAASALEENERISAKLSAEERARACYVKAERALEGKDGDPGIAAQYIALGDRYRAGA